MHSDYERTLMIGLLAHRDRSYANYTHINAGVLIAAVPARVVNIMFQRYFISGRSAGAVKG
jgi:ABC-type glycerol-3-phosphate transport system permease component